ncbi:DUF2975 domain-containing protein [Phenylobacterium sp. J367]|uniref:DUF2975 domain-containing protein n=1 Tax=Phenylobacterium sp. J367 TaxID=2898435 RepID=UPI002150CFDA|nr:DUF2975 domain-containing protein [Phenylobacterium sp. J367]MCR5878052.1 DUF2975 domain-containing protein [Phenylobacterium sp. J367]
MRALGPGSVSSFLKIILDVVYAALWVGVAAVVVLAFLALLMGFNPEFLRSLKLNGDYGAIDDPVPVVAGGLAAGALYLSGILAIVWSLRRIFATLTAGDPFHPDNVPRLRFIGLILAGLELGRYAVWGVSQWLLADVIRNEPNFSLTAWFSVLVVFVLAEVFREGARLRREAELTI